MNRGTAVWVFASLGAAAACGVITITPSTTAPVNVCTDNAACAKAYVDAGVLPQCAAGACIGVTSFRPIIVVAVPEGSLLSNMGGVTFGLPDTYETTRPSIAPFCGSNLECDFVPPVLEISSLNLRISKGLGITLWPPGLRPNQPDPPLPNLPPPTSLPIHAIFHPFWVDPASGQAMAASKLGLPLDDRYRDGTTAPAVGNGSIRLYGPTASTTSVDGTVVNGVVPLPITSSDPSSEYQIEIVPDEPFEMFPPYLSNPPLTIFPAQPVLNTQVSQDLSTYVPIYQQPSGTPSPDQPISEHDHEVDEATGAPSLEGWKLHVENADAVRISGTVTLPAGATKAVQVYDATGSADETLQKLYIDPPPGVDLPRLVVKDFGGLLPNKLPYPAIPPAVTVAGFVVRADDMVTRATGGIIFTANGQDTNAGFVFQADGVTPASTLAYDKRVSTTSAGEYQATLPPGSFRVYVVPDAADLALTVLTGQQVSTQNNQNGRALAANPRAHVRGRVILPGGSPVFAADVVIDPSADDLLPVPNVHPNVDPLARPREVRGQTDVDGRFDVLCDPGVVDISVRPHDGTNLPWVVVTNRSVPIVIPGDAGTADGTTLADVIVPLPSSFPPTGTGLLIDPQLQPLPHAVVRAFAFPASTPPADGGPPDTRAAREIGATVSDPIGAFQLFLAPPE